MGRNSADLRRNWDRIDIIEFKVWLGEHSLNTEVGTEERNYDSVFKFLKEKKYSGWITVTISFEDEIDGDATLRQARTNKSSREILLSKVQDVV